MASLRFSAPSYAFQILIECGLWGSFPLIMFKTLQFGKICTSTKHVFCILLTSYSKLDLRCPCVCEKIVLGASAFLYFTIFSWVSTSYTRIQCGLYLRRVEIFPSLSSGVWWLLCTQVLLKSKFPLFYALAQTSLS